MNKPPSVGTVTPEDFLRIREVFEAALGRSAAERVPFVEQACDGNVLLIDEVQRMLAADAERNSLLDATERFPSGAVFAGHFHIVSVLGRGGMGEVYRARDTNLKRDVALKLLPGTLALDPDRLARFKREAQVLASLNHPNIGAIYGLEESNGVQALVLELVEGPTLADRIAQGPIPADDALPIARQIAEGLEAAHEKGRIHRDLKPANIKITPEGVVKLLDFGLAKAAEEPATPADSPTLTVSATRPGIILGTASYMSPEQAAGKPVDKRSDIWSFGVVLWEMLTGKRLFEGETVSHTIAEVLQAEINFDKLPASTPAAIRDLLRRCLDRDVKTRLRDIGEARIAIQKCLANPAVAPEVAVHSGWPARLGVAALVAAVALLAAFGILAFIHFLEQRTGRDVVRFEFTIPEKVRSAQNLAVSPDGKRVTFAALAADGVPRLWIHSFDSLDFSPLIGTEGALLNGYPFWSWDSRFVVFQTGGFGSAGKLKRVEVPGGAPQTICDVAWYIMMGGFWNRNGQIVFGTSGTGLLQVPAAGGSPSPVTTLDVARQERNHAFPVLLPDKRHFLYRISSSAKPEYTGIYVGLLSAASPTSRGKQLLPDDAEIAFARSPEPGASRDDGNVLFVRSSTLMAQPFNAARAELSGEPTPIAQSIASLGAFGVSTNGVLVYRAGRQDRELTWFNRQGNVLAAAAPPAPYNFLALSPNDTRAAVQRLETLRAGDIWILDLTRGGLGTRFTFHPADDFAPVWSPDGKRIVWASSRDGPSDLYQRSITSGREEPLLQSSLRKLPFDWSSDGRYLLYGVRNTKGNADLWVLPMTGERKPWVFANTQFDESQGQFSPDMRWVAYQSDESGGSEIHVQPFSPGSGGGANVMVSSEGGYQPRWRRNDGKELYYFTGDGKLMAVDVVAGATLKLGQPHVLFAPPIWAGGVDGEVHRWDVSADGQKFLIPTLPAQAKTAFTVVMNWQAALKK